MPSVSRKMIYVLVCLSFLLALTGGQPAHAAGITVNTTTDENNTGASCSLREAITAANTNAAVSGCSAGSGTDTITLPAGTYTLSSELPAITSTIIINGNGAATTIVQANANPNTSGYRIISVNSGGNLTLNSLTARNGYISSGNGGGIYNSGTLTITNSAISGNNAFTGSGGGVFNDSSSTLTITNSTFSANSSGTSGGGVYNSSGATTTITNSTFSANSSASGGGVYIQAGATITIRNSTFSGNSASVNGGGILNGGTFNYANTIIANSTSGGDCVALGGAAFGTNINNLVESGTCGAALSGDPNLGSLADNGGPTQTMALISPSPALNAGDDATCAAAPVNNLDQRGMARPQGTHCDIGAYEVTPTQSGPALIVNSTADTSDDVCDLAGQGFGNQDCTLREAIASANAQAGANTITFAGNYTIPLTSTLPIVTTQITITGNGTANTIVQGGASAGVGQKHVFQISSTGNLTLDQVTVQYGSCTGTCSGGNGGGVLNQGTLTVTNSLFDRNNATTYGGSIANSGTLNVSNTTFTSPGVSTSIGGAIANLLNGTATISNSTFSSNSAGAGGAIYNDSTATLSLSNVTVTGNSATSGNGGGIANAGTLNVYNSTVSGNTAGFSADNVYQSGTASLYNVIIANSGIHGDCVTAGGTITATNSLIESTSSNACGLTNGVDGNIIGSDPNLGSLTGSPAYFPLNTGSPAIDTGDDAVCAAAPVNNESQNGVTRPVGSHCDIGSFESDTVDPTVSSITRASTNPTSAASVNYTVTFSEAVQNVDVSDFIITKSGGISGESVSAVSGSGATYTVTVNTGTGSGTLRLDVPVSASIQDLSNNALSGLPFTNGEVYTKTISATFKSTAANDGWILESTETSNTGGTLNSAQTTFTLGDDTANKQYRAILHFDTSALPDTAVVTNMTLKIKQQGSVTGTSPFTFASLYVDMRNPAFGTSALELTDFNFAAKKVKPAVFNPNPVSGWFSARFNNGGNSYVNRTGVSQLRLYFSVDDNNNNIADFIRFFSGNAAAGDRPKLLITYYVP